MRNPVIYVLITLILAFSFTPQGFAAEYTFTQLDFPGAALTWGFGINNSGQIVGQYKDPAGQTHGFLGTGGSFTTLDVPGALFTSPSGINNAGQIVGFYLNTTGGHGFLNTGGTFSTIDVPGATFSTANGINDLGQIVGDFSLDPGLLGGPPPATVPLPPTYNATGFLRNPDGTIVPLDVFGLNNQGKGINNAGQTVGTYGGFAGFLNTNGTITNIHPPDTNQYVGAVDINNLGQIVGFVNSVDDFADHGFLFSGGSFEHIDPPGAFIAYATGINDQGQIVGYFTDEATSLKHGFLATPQSSVVVVATPEPASLVFVGSGLAVLAIFRRRIVRRPVIQ